VWAKSRWRKDFGRLACRFTIQRSGPQTSPHCVQGAWHTVDGEVRSRDFRSRKRTLRSCEEDRASECLEQTVERSDPQNHRKYHLILSDSAHAGPRTRQWARRRIPDAPMNVATMRRPGCNPQWLQRRIAAERLVTRWFRTLSLDLVTPDDSRMISIVEPRRLRSLALKDDVRVAELPDRGERVLNIV